MRIGTCFVHYRARRCSLAALSSDPLQLAIRDRRFRSFDRDRARALACGAVEHDGRREANAAPPAGRPGARRDVRYFRARLTREIQRSGAAVMGGSPSACICAPNSAHRRSIVNSAMACLAVLDPAGRAPFSPSQLLSVACILPRRIGVSQRVVDILVDRLLRDIDLRSRFLIEPIETLAELHGLGLELTPGEIDLLIQMNTWTWCPSDRRAGPRPH